MYYMSTHFWLIMHGKSLCIDLLCSFSAGLGMVEQIDVIPIYCRAYALLLAMVKVFHNINHTFHHTSVFCW